MFCTPYLDEIKRIRSACGFQRIKEPFPNGGSKLDDFNRLLTEGVDIAVTHATFMNATEETIQRISEGDYILILDESVDPLWDFNNSTVVEHDGAQRNDKPDIDMLLENGIIAVKESDQVEWTGRSYDGGKFSALEALAKERRVYLIRNSLLLCKFPPEVFSAFSSVYVLTYIFNGSILYPYLDLHHLPYERKSIRMEDGMRTLVDYDP